MKILAIDTSASSGSITLLEDDRLLAELTTCIQKTHAERLLPSIKNLLDNAGIKIEDIDGFALTTGPGSFTGLRIGLSTIKGLAWSLNKPIVSVSTLEALAMNIPYSDKPICPVLDARKKEVYAGIYKVADYWPISVTADSAIVPEALVKKIKEPTIFLGDGVNIIAECGMRNAEFNSELRTPNSKLIFAPPHLWPIKASNIGLLAWKKFQSGAIDSPENIGLNYLRSSEAEIKMKQG